MQLEGFSHRRILVTMLLSFVLVQFTTALIMPDGPLSRHGQNAEPANSVVAGSRNRRDVLHVGFASVLGLVTAMTPPTSRAGAFDNKISTQYDDRPKRRGSKPSDLGVLPRTDIVGEEYVGLKHCGAAPNCFCSTDKLEDDPDHSIPAWIWPQDLGSDVSQVFAELTAVINAYPPGQSNVDGGGFKIITNDAKNGYMYIQFESLKNGYIDDVELAYIPAMGDRAIQVRSSSRLGYLDFGVNAKRLNYIAKALRARGWDAKGVDFNTHANYAIQNELV